MRRSGYGEECDSEWAAIRWRGQVASAIRGKRGQAFLRELIGALDAMPDKRLIAHDLRQGSYVCALGAIGAKRGVELERLDPSDHDTLSNVFGIARQLVQEIEWMNDDAYAFSTPEDRWKNMRAWAAKNMRPDGDVSNSPRPA